VNNFRELTDHELVSSVNRPGTTCKMLNFACSVFFFCRGSCATIIIPTNLKLFRHMTCYQYCVFSVAGLAYSACNGSGHINKVKLHSDPGLVPGLVTTFAGSKCICHSGILPKSLSLTIPPWVGAMNTGEYVHFSGKKRRVLRSSGPCYQYCLLYASVPRRRRLDGQMG